jgi:hypothetical protein
MAFVSIYRMGDVLALNLSKPMIKELGYSFDQIGRRDSLVALLASITGVGLGGLDGDSLAACLGARDRRHIRGRSAISASYGSRTSRRRGHSLYRDCGGPVRQRNGRARCSSSTSRCW